jgi:hypothetical protein
MDAGRKALLARGDNEVGPYQSPMEDGMQHFHEWYRPPIGWAGIGVILTSGVLATVLRARALPGTPAEEH